MGVTTAEPLYHAQVCEYPPPFFDSTVEFGAGFKKIVPHKGDPQQYIT